MVPCCYAFISAGKKHVQQKKAPSNLEGRLDSKERILESVELNIEEIQMFHHIMPTVHISMNRYDVILGIVSVCQLQSKSSFHNTVLSSPHAQLAWSLTLWHRRIATRMGGPHNSTVPHIMFVTGPSQGDALPFTAIDKRGPSAGSRRVRKAYYTRNRYSETLEKG